MTDGTGGAAAGRSLGIPVGLVATLFLAGAAPVAAQEDSGGVDLEVRGRALTTVHENFFRVPADSTERTVTAQTVDGRVSVSFDDAIELYGEAEHTWYETLGSSVGGGAGLRLGRRPNFLQLRGRYLADRPVFNLGDVVKEADILAVAARYSRRPSRDWGLAVDGRVVRVRFHDPPPGDNRIYSAGGSVRYFGLAPELIPELGGRIGLRRTDSPNWEDRRQRLYVRFVSMPLDGVWSSLWYRFRARSFPLADPGSPNFGRSDEGGQLIFRSSVRLWSPLFLTVDYSRLDMDSTLDRRTYQAQSLSAGLVIRL